MSNLDTTLTFLKSTENRTTPSILGTKTTRLLQSLCDSAFIFRETIGGISQNLIESHSSLLMIKQSGSPHKMSHTQTSDIDLMLPVIGINK